MNIEKLAKEILDFHGVRKTEDIDFVLEKRLRIDYLKNYLRKTDLKGYVLGISGGVDSTTAGKLCQIACTELKKEKYDATFYAVRLPHNTQKDELSAVNALDFINPDKVFYVNIGVATESIHSQTISKVHRNENEDFHKGNVKARMRMLAQYEIAGLNSALVVGTDHNSELVPAFYTKWGDQACDITVLNGLNKRQVRKLAETLKAPAALYNKEPTADLEDLKPLVPDEQALGFSYNDLDDFLEGKEISESILEKIVLQYDKTRHKRDWPVAFEI